MREVHRAEVRRRARGEAAHVEPEAARRRPGWPPSSRVRAERVGALAGRGEHQAAAALEPEVALERAELAERVDLALAVGADAERGSGRGERIGREDAVAEVALGERAGADAASGRAAGSRAARGAPRGRR